MRRQLESALARRGQFRLSHSLVELQKLAYFLQANGEPLRLSFEPATYGPAADDLRKALRAMEGHYTTGFGDGSAAVTDAEPIRVRPEISDELDQYIAAHPDTAARIQSRPGP